MFETLRSLVRPLATLVDMGLLRGHGGRVVPAYRMRVHRVAGRFKTNVACKSAFRIDDVVIESPCLVPPGFCLTLNQHEYTLPAPFFPASLLSRMLNYTAQFYEETVAFFPG